MTLFFGHRLTPDLEAAFDKRLLSLYRPYLTETEENGTRFLGKQLSPLTSLEELENTQAHILSLLKKLAPSYPLEQCQILGCVTT